MRDPSFWSRLIDAFSTDRVQEIADQMGMKYQSVRRWKNGEIPAVETLIKISNTTNRSIHWLLTGEREDGSKPIDEVEIVRRYLARQLAVAMKAEDEEMANYVITLLTNLESNGNTARTRSKKGVG